MKKNYYWIILPTLLFLTLGVMGCSSDENSSQEVIIDKKVAVDGLNFYLYPDSHEAVVDNGNMWTGELSIPSEIKYRGQTFLVKGIIHDAFRDCNELTKVRIPKTIDHFVHHVLSDDPTIGGAVSPDNMNPFTGCTVLESIEVDDDNPIMCSDGGVLFNKDRTQLYSYPAGARQETWTIPETVTWTGDGAFADNQHLIALTMPNSLTKLGAAAFKGCAKLKSIKLSERISRIGAFSFEKCESLHFLDIPESVQHFEESVFRWSAIKTLVIRGTFPDGLREDTFYSMDKDVVIYVQPSELEKFKKVFSGTILPLDSFTGFTEPYLFP